MAVRIPPTTHPGTVPARDHLLLAWATRAAAARLAGTAVMLCAHIGFALLAGEPNTPGAAFAHIGISIAASLLHGTVLGLLTAPALARFLPDANLGMFVRNTAFAVGFTALLIQLPIARMWLQPGTTYATSTGVDHTLPLLAFALLIGPAQYWAFRVHPKAPRYLAASLLAQLFGLALDSALQSALFGQSVLELPSAATRLAGITAIGFVVALPTGAALRSMAPERPPSAP
jgi:hypothetical protein